ncbi:hypothetical protein ACLKA7_000872 [Drosophila subpalustris]
MSFNEKLAAFAVVRKSISQRKQELTDRLTRNNNLVSRLTVALETELCVKDDDVDLLEVSNLGIPRSVWMRGSSAEYRAIGSMFGVSSNSVCNILHQFCRALVLEFTDEYLTSNFLTDSYVDECVQGFEAIGFPQCLGAIAEAVDHHNYKGWSSVVLLAMVDYRFQYVDIGAPGRCDDS